MAPLLTSWISFVAKMLALLAVCCMSKNDVADLRSRIQTGQPQPKYFEDDDSDSDWSTVGEETNQKQQGIPSHSQAALSRPCQHLSTTKRGSNGLVDRIRCKDCGMVLVCKRTSKAVKHHKESTRA